MVQNLHYVQNFSFVALKSTGWKKQRTDNITSAYRYLDFKPIPVENAWELVEKLHNEVSCILNINTLVSVVGHYYRGRTHDVAYGAALFESCYSTDLGLSF